MLRTTYNATRGVLGGIVVGTGVYYMLRREMEVREMMLSGRVGSPRRVADADGHAGVWKAFGPHVGAAQGRFNGRVPAADGGAAF